MKYAFFLFIFIFILGGAFGSGYLVGKANTKVEYVTQEKEVIRYVSKEKAKIHAQPNLSRDSLLELMRNGKL